MVIILKFHDDTDVKFHDDTLFQLHEVTGGSSGGRSIQKGVSVHKKRLGERPHFKVGGTSKSKLIFTAKNESKSKLLFMTRFESLSQVIPVRKGISISKVVITQKSESHSKTILGFRAESISSLNLHERIVREIKKFEKVKKLVKITTLLQLTESLESQYENLKTYEFSFSESVKDESLRAFTHSSSFVGNVRYDPETQKMRILLNGKPYWYCNISERLYDAFEGAPSKGAFFTRFIRDQFEC